MCVVEVLWFSDILNEVMCDLFYNWIIINIKVMIVVELVFFYEL